MAKAQRRGNKEAKKPKKIKGPISAPSTLTRGVLTAGVASPKAKRT